MEVSVKSPVKYFIWNKEMDFERGSHYNIRFLNPGIEIADIKKEQVFFTAVYWMPEKRRWNGIVC